MYVGTVSNGIKEIQFGVVPHPVINGEIKLGNVITLTDVDTQWRIVHIDNENNEVILAKEQIDERNIFNSSFNVSYSESTQAGLAETYEKTLPQAVQSLLITKQIHNVTAKVWIPQVNWISGNKPGSEAGTDNTWTRFDYFTNDTSRICRSVSEGAIPWWTASAESTLYVWYVGEEGGLYADSDVYHDFGFRPFICLPLS